MGISPYSPNGVSTTRHPTLKADFILRSIVGKKTVIGTVAMRRTANHRNVRVIDGTHWLVDGGDSPHTVILNNNAFVCDCYAYKVKGLCGHIMCVMRKRGISWNI